MFFSSSVNADYGDEQELLDIQTKQSLTKSNRSASNSFTNIIKVQPTDYYISDLQDTVTFNCVGIEGCTYQWQYDYGTGWVTSNRPGNQTQTLDVGVAQYRINNKYRCVVSYNGIDQISVEVGIILVQGYSFSSIISYLGSKVFTPLLSFVTPWGITFGALIVGIFGAPLLVKAYKKFF